METAIYIFTIINFFILCGVFVIAWKTHDALARFSQWLRHNNPGDEIDIIMGDGYRYKIKMDKKK